VNGIVIDQNIFTNLTTLPDTDMVHNWKKYHPTHNLSMKNEL
jgi:hypothetical protein